MKLASPKKLALSALTLFAVACVALATYAFKEESTTEKTADPKFWPNGKARLVGELENGVREGRWATYNEDGSNSELGLYRNGERVGTWTFWDQYGKFDRVEIYPNRTVVEDLPMPFAIVAQAANETKDRNVLMLAAEYAFIASFEKDADKTKLLESAQEWARKALKLKEDFESLKLMARITTIADFKNSKDAAEKAIEIGLKEVKNFRESDDFKSLSDLMKMSDGC